MTPSKPEDDDANTLECYRDAKVLQSLEVELDEMLVTTGQMRRDVLKYGYITKVSSVTRVARLGTNTGTRRRLGLSSADGTGTADAVLELPDQKPTATDDTSQLKTNTRDLVHALVAALSVEIKPEAYGGRESGWTTPAGRTSQIRVSLTRARAETWLWAMIQSRLLGAAYARMVDTEVGKFLKMCARTTHIGDKVLDVMDASAPRRFHADPEPSAEVAPKDATTGGRRRKRRGLLQLAHHRPLLPRRVPLRAPGVPARTRAGLRPQETAREQPVRAQLRLRLPAPMGVVWQRQGRRRRRRRRQGQPRRRRWRQQEERRPRRQRPQRRRLRRWPRLVGMGVLVSLPHPRRARAGPPEAEGDGWWVRFVL